MKHARNRGGSIYYLSNRLSPYSICFQMLRQCSMHFVGSTSTCACWGMKEFDSSGSLQYLYFNAVHPLHAAVDASTSNPAPASPTQAVPFGPCSETTRSVHVAAHPSMVRAACVVVAARLFLGGKRHWAHYFRDHHNCKVRRTHFLRSQRPRPSTHCHSFN